VAQRDLPIREIIRRARHDGCGGGAGKVELMTGIDGASCRLCDGSCCSTAEDPDR